MNVTSAPGPARLAEQQQALVQALFATGQHCIQSASDFIALYAHETRARGLNAYQSNAHALAQRSLLAAYPVVGQLLGHDSFTQLACALWHAQPPQRGDMACWGDALPDFVAASAQLDSLPWLADVARVEWALHQAATAADDAADLATLQQLVSSDPAVLGVRLAPGLAWVDSKAPVVSIVLAHEATHALAGDDPPALERLGPLLDNGTSETALVWRQGFKPRLRRAWAGEVEVLRALADGQSLGQALDQCPALDFNAWLPLAVTSGLLLAIEALAATHPRANPVFFRSSP